MVPKKPAFDPVDVGRVLRTLPASTQSEIESDVAISAADATASIRWLADKELLSLYVKANSDDCEGFIEVFRSFRKRIGTLEKAALHFRGRWAQACRDRPEWDGEVYSSSHICLYELGRHLLFTIWEAADPGRLEAASKSCKPINELDLDNVRNRWAAVRDAVDRASVDPRPILAGLDQELGAMEGDTLQIDDSEWPTVGQAAQAQAVAPDVISKAISNGKIRDNGKERQAKRVDPASLIEWTLNRIK